MPGTQREKLQERVNWQETASERGGLRPFLPVMGLQAYTDLTFFSCFDIPSVA